METKINNHSMSVKTKINHCMVSMNIWKGVDEEEKKRREGPQTNCSWGWGVELLANMHVCCDKLTPKNNCYVFESLKSYHHMIDSLEWAMIGILAPWTSTAVPLPLHPNLWRSLSICQSSTGMNLRVRLRYKIAVWPSAPFISSLGDKGKPERWASCRRHEVASG